MRGCRRAQAGLREAVSPVRVGTVLLLEEVARTAKVAELHHGDRVGVVVRVLHARQRVVAEGQLDHLRRAVRDEVRGAEAEGEGGNRVEGGPGDRDGSLRTMRCLCIAASSACLRS